MRSTDGKGLGIKRWHKDLGPNNITFIMKGCPQDWGPTVITEFLRKEGYAEVGRLSPPQSRAQGWLFTAEIAREEKERLTQVRVIKNADDPTEVITIWKHDRRTNKLDGDRILGVRNWTTVPTEPKTQEGTEKEKEETGKEQIEEEKEEEKKEKETKKQMKEVEKAKKKKAKEKAKEEEETARNKAQEQRNRKKQEAEGKIKEHEDFEKGTTAELVKKNDTAGLAAKNLTLKGAKAEQEKLLKESMEARVVI